MKYYNIDTDFGKPWSDYLSSSPIEDIRSVEGKYRTLYLSQDLLEVVYDHPDFLSQKLGSKIPEGLLFIITPEQRFKYESTILAAALGVKAVELDNSLGENLIGIE